MYQYALSSMVGLVAGSRTWEWMERKNGASAELLKVGYMMTLFDTEFGQ